MDAGGRDRRIQRLRGVAVLLVVVLHALKTVDGRPGSIAGLMPNDNAGAMGVDLFFVVSGAVMAGVIERAPAPGAFLRDRARRLLPMWWLAATAFLALALAFPSGASIESVVNTLTLVPLFDRGGYDLPIPGVGWTLGYEVVFYLLVAGALALPERARRIAPSLALAVLGMAGLALRPQLPLGGFCCNAILFEFLLGLLAARAARERWAARPAHAVLAVAVVTLALPFLRGFAFATDQWAVIEGRTGLVRTLAWGLPWALLLFGLTARPDRSGGRGLLLAVGDASYAIYLVHTLFTLTAIKVWPWWAPLGRDLLVACLVASGVGTGLAVHRWIERPLLARLRRQASVAASASTVSPRSLTSANPPSTWMRADTVLAPE